MAVQQEVAPRTATGGTATLADVLERVLDKGIVIAGDVKLFLANVEILTLQIRLVVCSVDKAKEVGLDWWTNHPAFGPHRESAAADASGRKPEDKKEDKKEDKQIAAEEPLARVEKRLGRLEDILKNTG